MNFKQLEKHFEKSRRILIESIEHVSIDEFLQISNENLLLLFKSPTLLIDNEDFLFQTIVQLIQRDFSTKSLF
jgi:hypothetical protein